SASVLFVRPPDGHAPLSLRARKEPNLCEPQGLDRDSPARGPRCRAVCKEEYGARGNGGSLQDKQAKRRARGGKPASLEKTIAGLLLCQRSARPARSEAAGRL